MEIEVNPQHGSLLIFGFIVGVVGMLYLFQGISAVRNGYFKVPLGHPSTRFTFEGDKARKVGVPFSIFGGAWTIAGLVLLFGGSTLTVMIGLILTFVVGGGALGWAILEMTSRRD